MSLNKDIKKREDKLLALSFYICVLAVVWILLQIVSFTSFRIPTDSMQPALHPGDNILVNKSIMGARIFNIWDAAEEKEVEIYRLPGMGKVKRNNVLVFHYPYPHKNDSLSMHLMKYYVKRCIALPGDTMGIQRGHYYIKGMDEPIGNVEAQERIARLDGENARGIVMDAYPWDKYIDWTIQDFGPLHVPAAGQTENLPTFLKNVTAFRSKRPVVFLKRRGLFIGDNLMQVYTIRCMKFRRKTYGLTLTGRINFQRKFVGVGK